LERILTDFIKALRSADVPVSIGESIDAAQTTALVGYGDRQILKDSLATAVAKSEEEKETFDRLFDIFFARNTTLDQMSGEGDEQSDQSSSGDDTNDLLSMIQSGDATGMAMAMERAAQEVGVNNIQFSTQTGIMTRRMLNEMGLRDLEMRMIELQREGTAEGDEEAAALGEARSELLRQARDYVEQQYRTFGEAATERFMEDFLQQSRLTEIDRRDVIRMQHLIKRMAKRLAAKHSRRRKARNRGQLDIRKTMRANAAYEGVPFETIWKRKKRERAKVVAICDVSGSVAQYAKFLLMLLYELTEVIPDIRSFAFSHKLIETSDDMESLDFDTVFPKILKEAGFGSTDYGQALVDLHSQFWDSIDRRTSVIILGDGRSNYGNPRIDIMKELNAQCKRVIWLCPEQQSLWGTGDSEIPRFAPFCHVLQRCSTVKDLERAVDQILSAYD